MDTRKILDDAKTVAVVGLSDNPSKISYRIAKYLQNEGGYRVIPVNPNISAVLGEKAYPSLSAIPEDIHIDIVNVFRRSEYLEGIVEDAIKKKDARLFLGSARRIQRKSC